MADSDVYGGSGWYQLALQAAAEAAQRALQQAQLLGYVTTPATKPTREQALTAIWQAIPAIQQDKKAKDPFDAVERWLNRAAPAEAKADPIAWAIGQGYIAGPRDESKTPTLEREQFEESARQWQQQFGEQTQQGREQTGLQYMQLLSGLKGPGDWLNYWNVTRAAQNTELPAWAAQLAQGRAMPAFQGAQGTINPNNVWLQPNQPAIRVPTDAYQYAAPQATGVAPAQAPALAQQMAAMYGGAAPTAQQATWRPTLPTIQAHQVTPQMWNSLVPSEQQGLIAMIEGQGGWGPDWMQQMQNAWPKGGVQARTFWS